MRAAGTLRVVTINTGKCDGPYRARIQALVAGLRELTPDVLLCQEAFESADGRLSTPRQLADGLGLTLAYHPLRRKGRDVEGEPIDSYSGLTTLSRYPLREVAYRPLPDDPADGDRGVLFATIDTPSGPCARETRTSRTCAMAEPCVCAKRRHCSPTRCGTRLPEGGWSPVT